MKKLTLFLFFSLAIIAVLVNVGPQINREPAENIQEALEKTEPSYNDALKMSDEYLTNFARGGDGQRTPEVLHVHTASPGSVTKVENDDLEIQIPLMKEDNTMTITFVDPSKTTEILRITATDEIFVRGVKTDDVGPVATALRELAKDRDCTLLYFGSDDSMAAVIPFEPSEGSDFNSVLVKTVP